MIEQRYQLQERPEIPSQYQLIPDEPIPSNPREKKSIQYALGGFALALTVAACQPKPPTEQIDILPPSPPAIPTPDSTPNTTPIPESTSTVPPTTTSSPPISPDIMSQIIEGGMVKAGQRYAEGDVLTGYDDIVTGVLALNNYQSAVIGHHDRFQAVCGDEYDNGTMGKFIQYSPEDSVEEVQAYATRLARNPLARPPSTEGQDTYWQKPGTVRELAGALEIDSQVACEVAPVAIAALAVCMEKTDEDAFLQLLTAASLHGITDELNAGAGAAEVAATFEMIADGSCDPITEQIHIR